MIFRRVIKVSVMLAAAMLAAHSCNVGMDVDDAVPCGGENITVSFNAYVQNSDTKALLDFPSVLWEDNDEIAVFDGSSRNIFTIPDGENNGGTARFSGNVASGSSEYYAVYPASAGLGLDLGNLTVRVPSAQTIRQGTCADPSALVCVSLEADGALFFKQVTSLLRLEITSPDVQQIRIGGTSVAGTAKVGSDGSMAAVVEGSDEIVLSPEGEFFSPGVYFAAMLPGTTQAGAFSLSVVRPGGLTGTRTSSAEQVFTRRKCKDAGEIEGDLTWERIIYTKQQLFEWNASRDPDDDGDEVSLGADIDMEMDSWTPRNFSGDFDGKGFKLYNLNVSSNSYAGFLRELKGSAVVKNLVVGSSDGVSYDGRSIICHTASANNYTWYYAGVVAKASESSYVRGIENFAVVEVASDAVSKTRIGGIVGSWNSSATLSSCVNRGTVRNMASVTGQAGASDTAAAFSVLGGVLGITDQKAKVLNCYNYGTVSTVNPGVNAVGGVVGSDAKGSTVTGCKNYGTVSQNATTILADTSVAGVLGYALGSSSAYGSLSGCSNEASVSAKGNGKIMRVGGVSGYTDYYNVSDCLNQGAVSFSNTAAVSGYIAIGGVTAHTYHGCQLSSCRNEGSVSSNKPSVNRVGGVVGTLNSSAMSDCTNTGTLTLDNSASAVSTWESAGGIAGFTEGTTGVREIIGCLNTGDVNMRVNTVGNPDYHRCAAGGIVGMPYTDISITGNVNKGAVTMQNIHASSPYAYAGGIFGQDGGAASGAYIKENINYGQVSLVSGTAGYCGAGGLFGNIDKASSVEGNCNYGSVQAVVAGAVAGINSRTFKVVVCDALTVNGTAHADASDKQAWASPQSSGEITLVVRPHSDEEALATEVLPAPRNPGNKVVAHRGGATECGYPDNSRAALRYAMGLGCYASECDIYWTSDNEVIVAHADSNDKVNGFHPWEATSSQIINAARLKNYERIPTLGEYLDIVMESGSKTKLLLDIKMITEPEENYDYPAKAALRALEIIEEKGARNFVEFICTGYEQVMQKIAQPMKNAGIPCGWMKGNISATTFKNRGYTDWANLCTRDHFSLGVSGSEDKGTGYRTITEFKNAGLQLSVFHLDKQSGNSSAVYTEANVALYLNEYQYLRCITTNYPSWLINKTKNL